MTPRALFFGLIASTFALSWYLHACSAQQRETTIKQLPAIVNLACSLVRVYPGSTPALEHARTACDHWDYGAADADEVLDAVKACELKR